MEVKARLQRIMELLVWRKQNLEGNDKRKAWSLIKKWSGGEMLLGCGDLNTSIRGGNEPEKVKWQAPSVFR